MTVSLSIDYSNGATRSWAGLPWAAGTTALEVLEAAAAASPALGLHFGSDRGGQAINVALDGVAGEEHGAARWTFWIGGRPAPERLGTETSFGFRPEARTANEVADGEHVHAKLVAEPDAPPE